MPALETEVSISQSINKMAGWSNDGYVRKLTDIRHGWGCQPNTAAAVNYLSAAASNAAEIEQMALQAGLKKGGAAKGELVLAIFELANCFRHGWGIAKDPIAAKQVGLFFLLLLVDLNATANG